MADIPLFLLNEKGTRRLAYDSLQWVVQKRAGPTVNPNWHGIAFVATEKRILLEVIREKGVDLTAEARARIDAMPSTFKAWLAAFQAQPEGRKQDLGTEDARAAESAAITVAAG